MAAEVPKLGQLASPTDQRDAIHIAVAPVEAGTDLIPGQHVGLALDGTATPTEPYLGIVDPFLTELMIHKGQRFWLCLYPGTITSLRHCWEHPSFVTTTPTELNNIIKDFLSKQVEK